MGSAFLLNVFHTELHVFPFITFFIPWKNDWCLFITSTSRCDEELMRSIKEVNKINVKVPEEEFWALIMWVPCLWKEASSIAARVLIHIYALVY